MVIDLHTAKQLIIQKFYNKINGDDQMLLDKWLQTSENRDFFDMITNKDFLIGELSIYHEYHQGMEAARQKAEERMKSFK